MSDILTSVFINNFILIFVAIDPFALIPIFAGIAMWLSSKLVEKLSMSLLSVIQRVFGLLLGALAIEYVISGIKNTFGL